MDQLNEKKGVIAAGHPETADAAAEILSDGGNAFDGVVAAQFTAFVVEPVLTSLGGGGFLMARTENRNPVLYDFFAETPGQKRAAPELQFYPISADFGEARQEYHIGPGSIAVPGMVKGLFRIHQDLCSLPIKRLIEPALKLARDGVVMNSFQTRMFDIIKPIYRSSGEAQLIFRSSEHQGDLVREGERLKQPELADTMDELARTGESLFYKGEIAKIVSRICLENGGHLTESDFEYYKVIKRTPLQLSYRQNKIFINPPPASGGILIAFALNLLESSDINIPARGSAEVIDLIATVQKLTNKARIDAFIDRPLDNPAKTLLDPEYLDLYRQEIMSRKQSFRGTTQISIADSAGNLASLTSSNGEGSGVMIPGTGIMLNNMLGEKDLNPGGFHRWSPNRRVTSMMAPGILNMRNGENIVFGSGGSNRIRTAILQVLLNLIDVEMSLEEAVNAPRIHFEEDELNLEGGFDPAETERVKKAYPKHKMWKTKNLFFGGAHAVSSGLNGFTGAGDERRGGVSVVC